MFPGLSGLSLIVLGLYAITTFSLVTTVVGLGGFAMGILFFRSRPYGASPAVVPAGASGV